MPSPRSAVLVALLLLMEILAGFSVVVGSSLLDATSLQYGMFWLFLLAGLAGVAVGIALDAFRPREPWDRLMLLACGAAASLIPAHLVSVGWVSLVTAAVLLAVAYWRGASVAQDVPDYSEVQSRFGVGFGILFTGLVWIVARGVIDRPVLWHMLAVSGIAYTIVAMMALVLARVERTQERGATGAIIMAVGLQLGFLALISLAAIFVFAHDLATALFNVTRPLWDAVGPVWFNLLALLFAPIQWILDLIHAHAHAAHHLSLVHKPPPPDRTPHKRLHANAVHSPFLTIAGVVILLAFVAGISAAIWKAAARFPRLRRKRGYDEERLDHLTLGAIWNGLLRWLHRLLHGGTVMAGGIAGAARRRIIGPDYPDDPVRRVYAQVLYRAANLGVPRPTGTTPLEFQTLLTQVWPDGAGDFAAVTGAYVQRRYGETQAGPDEINSLRERWQRLRILMRRQEVPRIGSEGEGSGETLAELPPREAGRRWRIEAQAIRELAMDLTGSVIALIAVFGFIIAAVVIGIIFDSSR